MIAALFLVIGSQSISAKQAADDSALRQALLVLEKTPVVYGHNDLPWELHDKFDVKAPAIVLTGTAKIPITKQQTDIARMRAVHIGGQFWPVWIQATVTGAEAVNLIALPKHWRAGTKNIQNLS